MTHFPKLDPLQEIDFKRMILRKAQLSRLDLSGLDFSGVNLENANLNEINLEDTNFSNSNLRGAQFKGSRLIRTNFAGSNLTGINIDINADYEGFIDVKLERANLLDTSIKKRRDEYNSQDSILFHYYKDLKDLFPLCMAAQQEGNKDFWQDLICSGVNFFKAASNKDLRPFFSKYNKTKTLKLNNAYFSGCDLHGINFSEMDLTGVNFSGADLVGADLTNTILINTNFIGANLVGANIAGAKISNTTRILSYFNEQELLRMYLHRDLDEESKSSLNSILIAKNLMSEVQESATKHLRIE